MLRALANERRLMILCKLVEWGEANVTALADAVGLSQSALSQHLAKMRDEGTRDLSARFPDALVPHRRSPDRGAVRDAAHGSTAVPQTSQKRTETIMTLRTISPHDAKRLIDDGAILVDIREDDEHARERIPGARHCRALQARRSRPRGPRGRTVIFHCRSRRTHGGAMRPAGREIGDDLRGFPARRRARRLAQGRTAHRDGPRAADRAAAAGADRRRRPCIPGNGARLGGLAVVSRHTAFRRRRPDCLQASAGSAAWRCCCSARRGTGPPIATARNAPEEAGHVGVASIAGRTRHCVGRGCRLLARAGRRRRLDPGGAAVDLRGGRAERAYRDRHQRAGGRRSMPPRISPRTRASGTVKWRCASAFAAAGVIGAFGGSSLSKMVDGQKLLALFAS